MKKLPYGVSNYEELIEYNCYYVDKTKYIEKIENLANRRVMFLRPRKFGKTLFTSTLECYYDINKKDEFDKLFKETYIGKNPTEFRNRYHILRFNFSGIDTTDYETTIKGFREKCDGSIGEFINKYNIEFYMNPEQSTEGMLNSLFVAFKNQKQNGKIYVIIDEYDHFANELLSFASENFKNLMLKNGKIRKWYEILKSGTESVVERIFITGVAPITLDSLTSGFNIDTDLTLDEQFNEMLGFTENELKELMNSQEISEEKQTKILPIMKENSDGYNFSRHTVAQIYNSNMSLYFLEQYIRLGRVPDELIDVNIASDYAKVEKMLDLCEVEEREKIIKGTLADGEVKTKITRKFNPQIGFNTDDMFSMLFYLGYLTEKEYTGQRDILKIPNKVMKSLYEEYYYNLINRELKGEIKNFSEDMLEELSEEGKIDKITELVHKHLNNLSNRNFVDFNENYIKFAYSMILESLSDEYETILEYEVNRKYIDLLIQPIDKNVGYYSVLIEFKYLKKKDEDKLEETKRQAKEQLLEYCNLERIKNIPNLKKYTIVAVVDELYVNELC